MTRIEIHNNPKEKTMCYAVSGITKSDGTMYMPPCDVWNHSHTKIAEFHGIPNGLIGDSYARWECTPKDGNYRSDVDTWVFRLDEERTPQWWLDDAAALEHSAREEVKRWLKRFPNNLVPGYKAIGGDSSQLLGGDYAVLTSGDNSTNTGGARSKNTGGDHSTNTGGYGSTNTGGNHSTNTGGYYSINTGGYGSTNTGGNYSINTGGDYSTNTGGEFSMLCWKIWDGTRYRLHVAYVGEDGVKPNTPYTFKDGKLVEVITQPQDSK